MTTPRAPKGRPTPSGLLLIAIGAVGGALALSTQAARTSPPGEHLLDGTWTAAYEAAFDDALPWKDLGIASWGAIDWFGFRMARSGAVPGADGWLFTQEEFAGHPDEAEEIAAKLGFVARVRDRLAREGISLVVALVPAKVRVCEARLGRRRLPAPGRFEAILSGLRSAGVVAPDLKGPLLSGEGGCDAAFLRTDTHWTPAGARRAADVVAGAIREAGLDRDLARTAFETSTGESREREGDLLRYVPLGLLQRFGPSPDRIVPETTAMREQAAASDLAAALLGDTGGPEVALVGTSYSLNPDWNFHGALRQALSVDVLNVAEEGGGPFEPMAAWLGSEEFVSAPPSLVVWETPERYYPVHYPLEDSARGGADRWDGHPTGAEP